MHGEKFQLCSAVKSCRISRLCRGAQDRLSRVAYSGDTRLGSNTPNLHQEIGKGEYDPYWWYVCKVCREVCGG